MAARWHIDKNGEPAVCHAIVRACPCGDQGHHFANRQEAEKYIERQNGSAGRSQGLKRAKARSMTVHRPSLNSQDFKPMRNQRGRLVGYAAQDRKTNRQVVLQPRRDGCSIMISSSAQGPYKGRFYYDSRTEGAAGRATDARSMIERYDQFVADQREHPTKLPPDGGEEAGAGQSRAMDRGSRVNGATARPRHGMEAQPRRVNDDQHAGGRSHLPQGEHGHTGTQGRVLREPRS